MCLTIKYIWSSGNSLVLGEQIIYIFVLCISYKTENYFENEMKWEYSDNLFIIWFHIKVHRYICYRIDEKPF